MPTLSTTTHIDVNLGSFTDDELIEEMHERGLSGKYDISGFDDKELYAEVEARGNFVTANPTDLTKSDVDYLLSIFPTGYKIGSPEYFVYENLVRLKQYAKN